MKNVINMLTIERDMLMFTNEICIDSNDVKMINDAKIGKLYQTRKDFKL